MSKKRFVIFDANSVIQRAYHALPPLKTKKGELVNAIYGFLLVFLKILREFQPDYLAFCFDFPAPTFRHKKYKEYKITRPPTPKELVLQISKIKEILRAFKVPIFEKKGFEADDLIGTISLLTPNEVEVIIVSGDFDLLQLINSHIKVYLLRKGVKDVVLFDENLFKEKFLGLRPSQFLDFKTLKGDPSDNLPGIKGIGEKTALELLTNFVSIKNLYEEIEKKKEGSFEFKPKIKEALLRFKSQVFLNKDLIEIKKDVPLDFTLQKCQKKEYDRKKVIQMFKDLEFESLIEKLEQLDKIQMKKNLGREEDKKEKLISKQKSLF